jgi:rhamnosyltransferase
VIVLLATRNGERWLDAQLDSILAQTSVEVRIIARDDMSTDRTRAILDARAASDQRLAVLPSSESSGSAAANFLRLLVETDFTDANYVAFADQDDVWRTGKLERHVALMEASRLDGVSSDVIAFDERGRRHLIKKSYPQRAFDFLLESPGPGSTFLISPRLASTVAELVRSDTAGAAGVAFHDVFVYATCRAKAWPWLIDDFPSVDYRQHNENVMGANVGPRGAAARLATIRSREHRRQSSRLADIAAHISAPQLRLQLESIAADMRNRSLPARLRLARRAPQLRRRARDRAIIGTLIALGIW